jgi:AI-2 transport protein TqsA
LPRAFILVIGVAAALVGVLAARELAWLIAPIFLSMVVVIVVAPVHTWMLRHGVPGPLALAGLLAVIFGVILVLVAVLAIAVTRLTTTLPTYAESASVLLEEIRVYLSQLGIGTAQFDELTRSFDPQRILSLITGVLNSLSSFGAQLAFVLSLLLFMGIESAGFGRRLAVLQADRPQLGSALAEFARNTRRFLAVTAIFGSISGVINALVLFWVGVPLPVLWALLSVICYFIPYVGLVIAVIPPALLALLTGGWVDMVLVILAYVIVSSLVAGLIQPYFVGDAVGVSVTVTLASFVFWAWVLGPVGAVLSVPLTLLVKAVLIDSDPRAAWAEALIGAPYPARRERRQRRAARRTRSKGRSAKDVVS